MIEVICNDETYTYQAYHMTKAFYPFREVCSRVDEKASNYVEVLFPEGNRLKIPGRQGTKSDVDKELYRSLKEITGHSLAWGILTGVRPTKIAMRKLEEGWGEEQFISWFTDQFFVSREKACLAWQIAGREKALLKSLDYENGYSLYVGIPFCPSVCTYCSFSSGALSDWADRVDAYLDALCRELAFIGEVCAGKKLNTIYIGGGTPTSLDAGQLKRLLGCIGRYFPREHLLEYTVEAGRPDSITEQKLQLLKAHSVTRISINPQTMQQKTLDVIGRKHTVEDICRTYQMAREVGFDNINMDLIAGLPGETLRDMEDTLRQVERLGPDSLTVHSLAIKRAAKMGQEWKQRGMESPMHETGAEEYDKDAGTDIGGMICAAAERAREMGLSPYYLYRQKNIAGNFENVGYAKVDKAGIYNILIMEEKQSIIAAGAGASTKLVQKEPVPVPGSKRGKETNLIRIENVKAIDAYIERIDEMIERKGEWLWH